MADYRTIQAAFWANADLIRLPWHARFVFAYVFSAGADDEGRFKADSLAILRNAFSPLDGLTPDDIDTDLQSLADADMLLLYGDGYGFLTGWYRHQYIEPRIRKESHLPPPPVSVNSWEVADEALAAYAKHTGKKRVYFRDAVTWWASHNGQATHTRVEHRELANSSRTVSEEDAIEGKGREGKGSTTLALEAAPAQKKSKRPPRYNGNFAAIVAHADAQGWAPKDAGQFMQALKAALMTKDTQERLVSEDADEAAAVILRVLQSEAVNAGAMGYPAGRSKVIARLIEIGAKLAPTMADEE